MYGFFLVEYHKFCKTTERENINSNLMYIISLGKANIHRKLNVYRQILNIGELWKLFQTHM